MNSRHLTGDAVDVVAYIGSQVSWEWPLYEKIAYRHLSRLPQELGIRYRMGRGLENAERRTSLSAEAISKTKPRLGNGPGFLVFTSRGNCD